MDTRCRFSLRLLLLFIALFIAPAVQAQNQRVNSLTATVGITNNGWITLSNISGVSVPPSGRLTLLASNNTLYMLTSAGTLVDLASGSGITANANQFTLSGNVLTLSSNALTTNPVVRYAFPGEPATNTAPAWTGLFIGEGNAPTLRHTTAYGDSIDLFSIRSSSTASISNIVYQGNQDDGKIFAWDWKIGGIQWGNILPRYVRNFLGNDEGNAFAQVGEYLIQTGTNSVKVEAFNPIAQAGGMHVWESTNNLLRYGAPLFYPSEWHGQSSSTLLSSNVQAAIRASYKLLVVTNLAETNDVVIWNGVTRRFTNETTATTIATNTTTQGVATNIYNAFTNFTTAGTMFLSWASPTSLVFKTYDYDPSLVATGGWATVTTPEPTNDVYAHLRPIDGLNAAALLTIPAALRQEGAATFLSGVDLDAAVTAGSTMSVAGLLTLNGATNAGSLFQGGGARFIDDVEIVGGLLAHAVQANTLLVSNQSVLRGSFLLSGALVLPPVTNSGTTISAVTNPVQRFLRATNTALTMSGTPAHGTVIQLEFINSGATNVTHTIPSAKLRTAFGATATTTVKVYTNSMTQVFYAWDGVDWWMDQNGPAHQESWGSTITHGQVVAFHVPASGPPLLTNVTVSGSGGSSGTNAVLAGTRTNVVKVAPYSYAMTTTTNFPLDGYSGTSMEIMSHAHRTRIRQDGVIHQVKLYFGQTNDMTEFRFKVWRCTPSITNLIDVTTNYHGFITPNATNTFSMNLTNVMEGDRIGFYLNGEVQRVRFGSVSASETPGMVARYSSASAVDGDSFGFNHNSIVIPMEVYMTAPTFIAIGDSITSGFTQHSPMTMNLEEFAPQLSYPWKVAKAMGATYQNLGIGSETSSNIVARFTNDVINAHPKFALILCGINDVGAGFPVSVFSNNVVTMVKACTNDAIVPVLLKITQWYSTGEGPFNVALGHIATNYNVPLIETRPGPNNPNTSLGFGSDDRLQARYSADGIHLTPNGNAALARLVLSQIQTNRAIPKFDAIHAGELEVGGTLQFVGQHDAYLQMHRRTNATFAPSKLIIEGQHGYAGRTNEAGGDLVVRPGASTGVSNSTVYVQVPFPASTANATDNMPTNTVLTISSDGVVASRRVASTNLTPSYVSGTNIFIDFSLGNYFAFTATNNFFLKPTNVVAAYGQEVVVRVTQDGTGSRTMLYSAAVKTNASLVLSTAANAVDLLRLVSVGGTNVLTRLEANYR